MERGLSTAVLDNDTIDTGLYRANGFIATTNTADTTVGFSAQSAGVVTVRLHTTGVAVGGAGVTVYWEAWALPYQASG